MKYIKLLLTEEQALDTIAFLNTNAMDASADTEKKTEHIVRKIHNAIRKSKEVTP